MRCQDKVRCGVTIFITSLFFLAAFILMMNEAKAETTDNLINDKGQLDHNSTYYYTQVKQTYNIPDDAEWSDPTQINWSVDVKSYDNAVGCYLNCIDDTAKIDINFYGGNELLDTVGPGDITLDYDGGGWSGWINFSGSYDDETYLSLITSVEFVLGGKDTGYWGGYYGPRFRNTELTFDYNVEEELITIEVEQDVLELIELIEAGEATVEDLEILLEEVAEELEIEDNEIEEVEETESSETEEISNDEVTESDEQDTDNESNESTEGDSNDTESVTMDTGNTQQNSVLYNTLSGGEEVLNLLDMVQNTNTVLHNNVVYADSIDFRSYTDISLRDTIELEDNNDWYENQAFYDNQNIPDSQLLSTYKYINIQDNKEWY